MTKRTKKQIEESKKDIQWSLDIRERDNHTCQMCDNKGKVHAHHILPRTIKEYRHELDNGITLCFGCHKVGKFSAHQNAIAFNYWLKLNKNELYLIAIERLKEIVYSSFI